MLWTGSIRGWLGDAKEKEGGIEMIKLFLAIAFVVLAVVIFAFSCFRGGYDPDLSHAVGILEGLFLGAGITLFIV